MKQTVNTGVAQAITLTDTGQSGEEVYIQNLGTGTVYVDTDPAVDATTGYKLVTTASVGPIRLRGQSLYAMASADGQDVRILLVG